MDIPESIPPYHNGSARVERIGNELTLRRRAGSFEGRAILLSIMAVWTAICGFYAVQVIREPNLVDVLNKLPFWACWCFGAYKLTWECFGSEHLCVGSDRVSYCRSMIIELVRQEIPLHAVKCLAPSTPCVGGELRGLVVAGTGRPVLFCKHLDSSESLALCGVLQDHLKTLMPYRIIPIRPSIHARPGEALKWPPLTPPVRPLDCAIRLREDRDRTVLVRRRPWNPAAVSGWTVATLVWNWLAWGGSLELARESQWFASACLIPHMAIGLLLLAGWLAATAAPCWSQKWVFTASAFSRRTSFLGLGRTERHDPSDIRRVELRPYDGCYQTLYSVVLVDLNGRDAHAIGELTEDDALWVGGHLNQRLKSTLPKVATAPEASNPLWDQEIDR